MSVLATIRLKFKNMTLMQQEIAKYILAQPANVLNMSITQLAAATGVKSESSIVRFYRILGFSGYHEFKVTLATEIAEQTFYHAYNDITAQDDINTIKQKIFQGGIQVLHENLMALDPALLEESVRLIEQAKRLIIIGYAPSGAVAFHAFFKFSRLGINCHFSLDAHLNAVVLAEPQDGDVVFCISYSGESKDVVIPIERARPTARIIGLTGCNESPLGQIADVCLTTISEEVNYWTDAMLSRIVQNAIIDTLYTAIGVRKGGRTWERLKKTRQNLFYLKC